MGDGLHDVFISYSSKDKTVADAVCATLERDGVRCWVAPRDISIGQEWAGSIVDAIANAKVFVLLFSSFSNSSLQVRREVERAAHHELPILPFRLEEVAPNPTLEYFLSTPHWLDAFNEPLEQHIQKLSTAIKALLSHEALTQSKGAARSNEGTSVASAGNSGSSTLPDATGVTPRVGVVETASAGIGEAARSSGTRVPERTPSARLTDPREENTVARQAKRGQNAAPDVGREPKAPPSGSPHPALVIGGLLIVGLFLFLFATYRPGGFARNPNPAVSADDSAAVGPPSNATNDAASDASATVRSASESGAPAASDAADAAAAINVIAVSESNDCKAADQLLLRMTGRGGDPRTLAGARAKLEVNLCYSRNDGNKGVPPIQAPATPNLDSPFVTQAQADVTTALSRSQGGDCDGVRLIGDGMKELLGAYRSQSDTYPPTSLPQRDLDSWLADKLANVSQALADCRAAAVTSAIPATGSGPVGGVPSAFVYTANNMSNPWLLLTGVVDSYGATRPHAASTVAQTITLSGATVYAENYWGFSNIDAATQFCNSVVRIGFGLHCRITESPPSDVRQMADGTVVPPM